MIGLLDIVAVFLTFSLFSAGISGVHAHWTIELAMMLICGSLALSGLIAVVSVSPLLALYGLFGIMAGGLLFQD